MHRNSEYLKRTMMKAYPADLPGAALLVLEGDNVLIGQGFGMANVKTGEKISADTHFRMASVSKQFTAATILLLEQQGKLRTSDKIRNYLPQIPDFAADITIHQLLTHTSGIADYEPRIPKGRLKQVSDKDVLEYIVRSDSLFFIPGTRFKYSNTGYCLLTQIVEAVAGSSYATFIRKHIFRRLRMPATTIYSKDKNIRQRAFGYSLRDNIPLFADQSLTSATMGDGSVYTSLNEYEKWIRFLWRQNKNIAPLQPHVQVTKDLYYGYGWFTGYEADGSPAYFHSGESTGFRNMVYHNPHKKLLIALFSNRDDERASYVAAEVMAAVGIQLRGLMNHESLFDVLSNIYGD